MSVVPLLVKCTDLEFKYNLNTHDKVNCSFCKIDLSDSSFILSSEHRILNTEGIAIIACSDECCEKLKRGEGRTQELINETVSGVLTKLN